MRYADYVAENTQTIIIPETINQTIRREFVDGITLYRNARSAIFGTCQKAKMAGLTQTQITNLHTEAFKQLYPIYNFSAPSTNPVEQKHIYDNTRKAISDFFVGPRAPKVKVVAPTVTPPVATTLNAGAIYGVTSQVPVAHNPAPAAMTLEKLQELVLNAAESNPAWAKALALTILSK
jgi:hypothetical protein